MIHYSLSVKDFLLLSFSCARDHVGYYVIWPALALMAPITLSFSLLLLEVKAIENRQRLAVTGFLPHKQKICSSCGTEGTYATCGLFMP